MPGCVRKLLCVLALAGSLAAQDDIAQLGDPDPDVRIHAAERLGEQRVAAAVPALIDAAYDPSPWVAAAAVDALGRIGPPAHEAVPRLEELALGYPGFHDRVQRAVRAIGRPSPTVPALIVWLRKNGKLGKQVQTLDGLGWGEVDAVARAFHDKDPSVRAQAALVLGRYVANRPEVVAALLAARDHESAYVRGHVFRALVKDGATAAQAFAKDLEHDDVSVRRVAALALDRMGRAARVAMPALIRAVKDEDFHVRRDAIRAIGEQRAAPKEAVIALTEVLEEGDERLTETVIYACRMLGRDAAPATLALAVFLEGDDPELRSHVCSVLANIGPEAAVATPALIQVCFDESWNVASGALGALERIGPGAAAAAPYVAEFGECHPFAKGAVPPVLRALGAGEPLPPAPEAGDLPLLLEQLVHEDPWVAGNAAFLIGRLAPQDEATRDALRAALRHKTPYVRRHASFALRRIGPASTPVLIDALEQGGTVERRLAADVLWQLARELGQTAFPALHRALGDPDIYVRRQACTAIGVIGAPARTAIPALVAALRGDDLSLARSAAWALGNMKSAAHGTVGTLTEVLAERDDQSLRWSILVALGEFGAVSEPAIPTIKEAVRGYINLLSPALDALVKIGPPGHAAVVDIIHAERGIPRQLAIEHVLRTGIRPPGLREALEQAVQDADPGARRIALQALQRLQPEGPTSVAALVAALRHEPKGRMHRSAVPHALAANATVGELFALVTDEDERVRWGAFRALALKPVDEFGKAERKRARDLVRRAQADKSPQVRAIAVALLQRLPPAKVTPDLIRAVGEASDHSLRQSLAASLAAVGAPAVPALIRALRHDDPVLRRGAATTVVEMGPVAKATVPALAAAASLNDEDVWLHARALAKIGKDALAAMIRLYGKVKHQNARRTLADAIVEQGAASVSRLDALRRKGDVKTRRWTVALLVRLGEPALPSLLDAASDPEQRVAWMALNALGRHRNHAAKVAPVLIRALRRRELRTTATSALRSLGTAALPWVRQAAVDDVPVVRAGAYSVLRSLGDEALPLLRRGLDDPDDKARAAAVRALAGPAGKTLVPELIRALRDESVDVRVAAAYALGQQKPVPKEALTELLRLFRIGTPGERKALRRALIELEAAPHVARFLADPDRTLRGNAAGLLAEMGEAALPSLVATVKTQNDPARRSAAWVMGRIGAQKPLVAFLVHDDPGVRASAAHGLGEMGRRALGAVPRLIKALDDRDADVVLEAVSALGRIGPGAEDAVPRLLQLRKKKRYREAVTLALRKIRRGK